jgi:hypothetical protein
MDLLISRRISAFSITIATLFCGFFIATNALAATANCPSGYVATSGVCIFKATGATAISADFNSATGTGTYLNLVGPIIAETTPNQIGTTGITGSSFLQLIAPLGFQFKNDSQNDPVTVLLTELDSNNLPAHNINGLANGATIPALISTTSAGFSAVTIPILSTTTAGNYNSLSYQGIKIVPTGGVPLNGQSSLPSGLLEKAAGSIGVSGVAGSANGSPTSLGTIAEVPGVMARANISVSASQVTPFSLPDTITISGVTDQFGNMVPDGTNLGLQTSLGMLSVSGCGTVTSGNASCTFSPVTSPTTAPTGTATLSIPGVTLTGTTSITVAPGPTKALTISASPSSLTFGNTTTVTVLGKDSYGNTTTTDSATQVTFSVLDGGATITNDSPIVTMQNGSASVTIANTTASVVHVGAISSNTPQVATKITFLQVDTVAPFVSSTLPSAGSTGIDPTATTYSITFSKPLDTNTVSSANIQLINASDNSVVPAIVSPAEGDTQVIIQPTAPLDFSTTYYFAVSGAVTDQASPVANALSPVLDSSTQADYSFTTEDDPTVLGITGVTLTKSSATADDSFDDGWQWVMNVTVPTDQDQLGVNFDDWMNTDLVDTIPVVNDDNSSNVEFYSPQSSDAPDVASAVAVTASLSSLNSQKLNQTRQGGIIDPQSPTESSMTISGDLDPKTPGNQIKLYVNVKIPQDAVPGSYFTQYDLSSN